MQFNFNFYSSLLLIFFVHGLVYAMLLLRKGIVNESPADKWLSLYLLLCILYIAPWMIGFAGWYDNQPYRDILFYVPFQHLFFIGPVIFFYVQSLLNPSFRFTKKHVLHLLPGILYLIFCVVMVITDKLVLKKYYFLANEADPDFAEWYQVAGFISMLIYFYLSLRYYNMYKKLIVQLVSYAELVMFRWVRNFLMAFFIILCVRLIFYITGFIFEYNYTGVWWYFLSFAIIFYYIAITGYSNSIEAKVPFKLNLLEYRRALLLQYPNATSENLDLKTVDADVISIEDVNKDATEESEHFAQYKEKLLQLLKEKKVYEDPELSLTQLAKQLETNPSNISKVINQGFALNFNDFINRYRIDTVKEMLKQGEHKNQTLLGIAYECGFNSKATFNRAFKKITGQSPKEWLKKNIK